MNKSEEFLQYIIKYSNLIEYILVEDNSLKVHKTNGDSIDFTFESPESFNLILDYLQNNVETINKIVFS